MSDRYFIPVPKLNTSDIKRFWSHVDKSPGQGPKGKCWTWTGALDKVGYARMRMGDDLIYVHRIGFTLQFGKIPKGKRVLHKCDNPECTKPEHLFLGDMLDNTQDMCEKDRNVFGVKHPLALLNDDIVRFCRKVYNFHGKRYNANSLAKLFGVSRSNIYSAVTGRSWPHVDMSIEITDPYLLSLLEEFNNRPVPVKSNKIIVSKDPIIKTNEPESPKKVVVSKNPIIIKKS